MSRKRRQYSNDFKAKVALAALKGDQTTSEIAARFVNVSLDNPTSFSNRQALKRDYVLVEVM